MLWFIILGAIGIVLAGGWFYRPRRGRKQETVLAVAVGLHAARRRLDVFQFKVETRRDAAVARRRLSKELRDLEQQQYADAMRRGASGTTDPGRFTSTTGASVTYEVDQP